MNQCVQQPEFASFDYLRSSSSWVVRHNAVNANSLPFMRHVYTFILWSVYMETKLVSNQSIYYWFPYNALDFSSLLLIYTHESMLELG